MNNPFYYTPSPECRKAARELADWLSGRPSPFCDHPADPAFRAEIARGKMFGVLVVDYASLNNKEERIKNTVADSKPSSASTLNSPLSQGSNHKASSLSLGEGRGEASKLKPQSYIAAYSGQVCGRADWPEFAPAVFDYLQPGGYFKTHEAEIVRLNADIAELSSQASPACLPPGAAPDPRPTVAKGRREGETEAGYIRRRQFENAELHRWKLRQRAREKEAEALAQKARDLKTLRKKKSDDLQRWLFSRFHMLNGKGETKDLVEIANAWRAHCSVEAEGRSLEAGKCQSPVSGLQSPSLQVLPPSGSGECCEPKLLQYAFAHGLKPVSMAMFWWGESPKGEVRHHLHFYPACNSKCKPILHWMLQGVDVEPNPLESKERDGELAARIKTIYEDADICVIVKPAGLLSVPGKEGRESVQSVMRRRYPDSPSPLVVHRLDMDTSGLMVIAKTMEAYHGLQRQFARHEVRKRYVAILEAPPLTPPPSRGGDGVLQETTGNATAYPRNILTPPIGGEGENSPSAGKGRGRISLPLRPDLDDRPRQVVDFEHGKEAVTHYEMVGPDTVWLYPMNGRTHQLRVHCAHRLGLGRPIKGDALYGTRADRLYLHAEEMTFRHPTTGRTMRFTSKADFISAPPSRSPLGSGGQTRPSSASSGCGSTDNTAAPR